MSPADIEATVGRLVEGWPSAAAVGFYRNNCVALMTVCVTPGEKRDANEPPCEDQLQQRSSGVAVVN